MHRLFSVCLFWSVATAFGSTIDQDQSYSFSLDSSSFTLSAFSSVSVTSFPGDPEVTAFTPPLSNSVYLRTSGPERLGTISITYALVGTEFSSPPDGVISEFQAPLVQLPFGVTCGQPVCSDTFEIPFLYGVPFIITTEMSQGSLTMFPNNSVSSVHQAVLANSPFMLVQFEEGTLFVVPEPGTYMISALGLLAIAVRRKLFRA